MTVLETSKLNAREVQVLMGVILAHGNAGGDFAYADEVYEEIKGDFTMNQVKGYLSQLVQKKFIMIDGDFDQINLRDTVYEIYPKLDDENYCSVYGKKGNV